MTTTATLLVHSAAELVTVGGPAGPRRGAQQRELSIVRDGAFAAGPDGDIVAVGTTRDVRDAIALEDDATVIDASDRAVLPGFVDPHTHAVFGGDRADEFASRLEGADYLEILAGGGGILSTVRATRGMSEDELFRQAQAYLGEMLREGTTTLEIKSGYGLALEEEVKLLRVARRLGQPGQQTVVATLLGAHAVPPEYHADAEAYVQLVCNELIPRVAAERLASFCDVFCERGVFSVEQSRKVLQAGLAHGLRPKLHAEQKSLLGGTRLGVELGAASVDHLEHAGDDEIAALAAAGETVAVLLPGAAFVLGETVHAPARRLVECGVPVALATDFNPGTCPILSMPLVLGLACLLRLVSPAEAIVAATCNAAHAIGLGHEVGSLEVGKRADALIINAASHTHLAYWFGRRGLVRTVVKDGRVVVHEGTLLGR